MVGDTGTKIIHLFIPTLHMPIWQLWQTKSPSRENTDWLLDMRSMKYNICEDRRLSKKLNLNLYCVSLKI